MRGCFGQAHWRKDVLGPPIVEWLFPCDDFDGYHSDCEEAESCEEMKIKEQVAFSKTAVVDGRNEHRGKDRCKTGSD